MKKTFRTIFLLAAALTVHTFLSVLPAAAEEASVSGTVTAYYFHGAFRCPTCNKMEQYSRETIERDFKNEVDAGRLAFKAVNIESKGNEHFVNDYQLYTKALILSFSREGREIRFRNLDKIWEYAGNRERFENYVREETAAFLKES